MWRTIKFGFGLLLWISVAAAQVIPDLYIVELSEPPVAAELAKGVQRAAATDRLARIQAGQQVLRGAMASRGARVLHTVDTVANAMVVSMPDSQAAGLAALDGVKRVLPVYEVRLFLDRAHVLHHVKEAWERIGADRAGLGAKIGIIDTGIDSSHPGFQDATLVVPEGFPKLRSESDREFTNNKVIVVRGYEDLYNQPNPTGIDRAGHGTGVAMAAAGVPHDAPLARITGVAPKAQLGNYKVFPGIAPSGARTDVILRALDDAVKDGMDVINLSLGSVPAARPTDDILADAVERAVAAGVIVVTAAGNGGSDPNTMGSPASAPSAIAVGATWTDRLFGSGVEMEGTPPVPALPSSGQNPKLVSGPMKDVATLDPSGLACGALPADSLAGQIAFILRGTCFFEEKLNNAQRAGAIGALVYTNAEQPVAIMSIGAATLPGMMVTYDDGVAIKARLAENPALPVTLRFEGETFAVNPNRVASFSSRGPAPDDRIKPDLAAVGLEFYTATQTNTPGGELYDLSGYLLIDGSSFSTPLVAGAAAVVKAAHPGLSVQQYRSLLINSATPIPASAELSVPVQQTGAGVLNLDAALRSTVTAFPASVSFGVGGGTLDATREITISNVGSAADTLSLSVTAREGESAPAVSAATLELAPGASQRITLRWTAGGLEAREYQGFVRVRSARSETESRIPYWHAVPATVPRYVTLLRVPASANAGALVTILFRVTETSGVALLDLIPNIVPVSGGGSVVSVESADSLYPGAYRANLRLSIRPGNNVFSIEAGSLARDITIFGEVP